MNRVGPDRYYARISGNIENSLIRIEPEPAGPIINHSSSMPAYRLLKSCRMAILSFTVAFGGSGGFFTLSNLKELYGKNLIK